MGELTEMRNIGREMAEKLTSVGIGTREELLKAGAWAAFTRLKGRYPQVCLVHLYALEGAVEGVEFHRLPAETKQELKTFSDGLRAKDGGANNE